MSEKETSHILNHRGYEVVATAELGLVGCKIHAAGNSASQLVMSMTHNTLPTRDKKFKVPVELNLTNLHPMSADQGGLSMRR